MPVYSAPLTDTAIRRSLHVSRRFSAHVLFRHSLLFLLSNSSVTNKALVDRRGLDTLDVLTTVMSESFRPIHSCLFESLIKVHSPFVSRHETLHLFRPRTLPSFCILVLLYFTWSDSSQLLVSHSLRAYIMSSNRTFYTAPAPELFDPTRPALASSNGESEWAAYPTSPMTASSPSYTSSTRVSKAMKGKRVHACERPGCHKVNPD